MKVYDEIDLRDAKASGFWGGFATASSFLVGLALSVWLFIHT